MIKIFPTFVYSATLFGRFHVLLGLATMLAGVNFEERLLHSMQQLQNRFETMPYWNRVRMVEKLGLADTESISRHFEDMEDGALYYPSIYVNCEKQDHIIIGNYTCYGRLYGNTFTHQIKMEKETAVFPSK